MVEQWMAGFTTSFVACGFSQVCCLKCSVLLAVCLKIRTSPSVLVFTKSRRETFQNFFYNKITIVFVNLLAFTTFSQVQYYIIRFQKSYWRTVLVLRFCYAGVADSVRLTVNYKIGTDGIIVDFCTAVSRNLALMAHAAALITCYWTSTINGSELSFKLNLGFGLGFGLMIGVGFGLCFEI